MSPGAKVTRSEELQGLLDAGLISLEEHTKFAARGGGEGGGEGAAGAKGGGVTEPVTAAAASPVADTDTAAAAPAAEADSAAADGKRASKVQALRLKVSDARPTDDTGAVDAEPVNYASEWGVETWVQETVAVALLAQIRSKARADLAVLKGRSKEELQEILSKAQLLGLLDVLWDGVQQLPDEI